MAAENLVKATIPKRQRLRMGYNQVRNRMAIHKFAFLLVALLRIPAACTQIDVNVTGWSTTATYV
jgi:hypothetical protein